MPGGWLKLPETVGKRLGGFGGRAAFFEREGRTVMASWRVRLVSGDQVLIAAISGPTPKIVIIRFRL
jgi:hypothetical protein